MKINSLTRVAIPRRVRRVIAVLTLLGLPGSYALWSVTAPPRTVWAPVGFALILVSAVGAIVLYTFAGDRATRSSRLDERERQLRDQAWVVSYTVLSISVVVAVAAASVIVLGFGRTITLDWRFMSGVATCFGVLVPVLPAASLAWLEPDPPAED